MKIEEKYIDIITELVNIGMGKSADILNEMLESHICLGIPHLKITNYNQVQKELGFFRDEFFTSVNMNFTNEINGVAQLLFPEPSASELINIFVGKLDNESNLDALRISALTEISNIIINTIVGTISNYLEANLAYSVPRYTEGNIQKILAQHEITQKNVVLFCHTDFNAKNHNVSGNFILYFEVENFDNFIKALKSFYSKIEL